MRPACAAVVLALPLLAVPAPPNGRPHAPASPPLLGAHYYPWYAPDRWAREPAAATPALGHYRSDDPAVVAQHVRWARDADLDFFVLSHLDPRGPEAKTLRDVTVPGLAADGFRFALHYETPIALGLRPELPTDFAATLPDATVVGDRFVEHFDHLADQYLRHPQYLRYGGRPVVMLYLVRTWVNAGPYLRAVRERMAARNIDPYLIADVMYWEEPGELDWPFLADHFQAVTGYNMYDRPDFLPRVRRQYAAADRTARGRGMRMIPHVLPGYDDTRLRGTGRVTYPRRGGAFYRAFWELGATFVGPDQPFLIVTTFNEWHEGTALEPTATDGGLYLRLTRELAAGLRGR